MLADDVVTEPVRIIDGHVTVSARPGLGVELYRAKLEKYHEAYKSQGYAGAYGDTTQAAPPTFFIPNQ